MIPHQKIESVFRLDVGGRVLRIDPTAIKTEKAKNSGNESWLKSDLFFISARTDGKGICVIQFLIATKNVSLPLFISYGLLADEWELAGNESMTEEIAL